ncbi:sensor c-di-GMP phosphodiesterase, contains CSS-motif sensor and EAL domain [Xaviernesmea oryzae]|uniref:cyclic-guanylate-specific phosphodiesterase n=1 Tax=Xaviernesmea oryzae TaxID=464029 RepID=A0A1X7GHI7_9HYPH|nr:EAL domain-containing protein [Xaviernesmea oryzae]SMF69910.1 sensor c-di-GMP phosphodiesterase, contains CSS-motif sensor and EAL domain [Xaviernesmea oryzae]
MELRRSRVIAAAILLGLLGAIVPIAAMAYISWTIAVEKQQDNLERVAEQTIMRAGRTFEDAKLALDSLAYPRLAPCSPQHIARMRVIAFNTPSVAEVGYIENGRLKCTSWGVEEGEVDKAPIDYVTPDGLEVTTHVQPAASMGNPVMALHYGGYSVLMDPARFVDILVEDDISLALANQDGLLISKLNSPDPALVETLSSGEPRKGMTSSSFYAVARDRGLIAIAMEPRANLAAKLREEQFLLLPVGAFIAIFIVGIVAWLSRKRLSPLGELSIAVRKREFIVHYQPIVELKTGTCIGAEALVRWQRPDGSLVRPDLFIPLAEESGLILPITDQVIEAIIAELGALLRMDRSLHVAVNLSAADVTSGRALDVLEDRLAGTEIESRQIWLEATERGFIDIDAARATLARARERGHAVAIDDFGTGYSSLQYLQGLPMDALKIDKSFIDTIGRNSATSSVTSHIIEMAKTLDLHIVAEGVETEEQADYLKARDVNFGQGWLFSKPLPAPDFIRYYRNAKASREDGRGNIRGVAA